MPQKMSMVIVTNREVREACGIKPSHSAAEVLSAFQEKAGAKGEAKPFAAALQRPRSWVLFYSYEDWQDYKAYCV